MKLLDEDIAKAIKANLPAATAEHLRTYFEDHEQLERDYEASEKKNKILEDRGTKDLKTIKDLSYLQTRESTLAEGERILKSAQIKLDYDNQVLDIKTKCTQDRVDDHKNMVSLIFRNTILKENIVGNQVVSGGQYTSYSNGQDIVLDSPEQIEPNNSSKTTEET